MENKKIWALLVHLSKHMWGKENRKDEDLPFEDDVWTYILDESKRTGMNMIVLDLGDGIKYESHPELSMDKAWTADRVREELRRCRERGIELIPKINFSAGHDQWLWEYRAKRSTPEYLKMAEDLIKEVYELFDHPRFIHLGFDEENPKEIVNGEYRSKGEFRWTDMRFMFDCVKKLGSTPWIWSCPLFDFPEEYKKYIAANDGVLSPWYYNSFRKENWTSVETRAEYVAYYNEDKYKELGIKFVEEDPFLVRFRDIALPLMKEEGYKYIPCTSVFNRCDYNTADLYEYFRDNAPDEQVLGFIAAPWFWTTKDNLKYFEETFKFFEEAKEKFYPNN